MRSKKLKEQPKTKIVYLILGSVGSGKSTLLQYLLSKDPFNTLELVSDDIYKRMFFHNTTQLSHSYQQARTFRNYKLSKIWSQNMSFIWEFVPSKIEKIEQLKELISTHNYKVVSFFIGTLNYQINLERVEQRVVEGADEVKENKIITRHEMCLENIFEIMNLSKDMYFLDNSNTFLDIIACKKEDKIHVLKSSYWFEKYILNKI